MNCLNSFQSGIVSKKMGLSVTFDIALDAQFTKTTTTDSLYDVYTIVGQKRSDEGTFTDSNDKIVNATFKTINTSSRTIYYVCVGGGGYTYSDSTANTGGGGAGAFFEGAFTINANTSSITYKLTAGGSYNTSSITQGTNNTATSGRGGIAYRLGSTQAQRNGTLGSSGGGSSTGSTGTDPIGQGVSPGNDGGDAVSGDSASVRAAGGGGGAGGAGREGVLQGGTGRGGAGGAGKVPSNAAISSIYPTALCVGGGGHGGSTNGSSPPTFGSGAGGRSNDSTTYRYGQPGAIIIAVPRT